MAREEENNFIKMKNTKKDKIFFFFLTRHDFSMNLNSPTLLEHRNGVCTDSAEWLVFSKTNVELSDQVFHTILTNGSPCS